jgi:hypothetical protein
MPTKFQIATLNIVPTYSMMPARGKLIMADETGAWRMHGAPPISSEATPNQEHCALPRRRTQNRLCSHWLPQRPEAFRSDDGDLVIRRASDEGTSGCTDHFMSGHPRHAVLAARPFNSGAAQCSAVWQCSMQARARGYTVFVFPKKGMPDQTQCTNAQIPCYMYETWPLRRQVTSA